MNNGSVLFKSSQHVKYLDAETGVGEKDSAVAHCYAYMCGFHGVTCQNAFYTCDKRQCHRSELQTLGFCCIYDLFTEKKVDTSFKNERNQLACVDITVEVFRVHADKMRKK